MPKLPHLSGREIIRALKRLGFETVRQNGSHVLMRCGNHGCVVPLHKPVKLGTLRAIARSGLETMPPTGFNGKLVGCLMFKSSDLPSQPAHATGQTCARSATITFRLGFQQPTASARAPSSDGLELDAVQR